MRAAIVKSLAVALAVALCAGTADAGRTSLRWNGCPADDASDHRRFACDTDVGDHILVGSFTLDHPQEQFVGVEVVVDSRTNADAIPPWWQFFNAGSCRLTSLSAQFDFSVLPGGCADPFGQPALGGLAAYCLQGGNCVDAYQTPTRARIKAAGAIAEPVALEAEVEYYAVRFRIDNAGTTTACAGCATAMCFELHSVKAVQINGLVEIAAAFDINAIATWQSAIPCYVSTIPTTWGQIKSQYR
jgi:hypothetical protein